jgi:Tfp pilus assembly protein PilF
LAGRFDEGISVLRRSLNQNPRNTPAVRELAVCLVKQGRRSEAAQVAREVLAVEPQLTLTKLRARTMYLNAEILERIFGGIAYRRNTRIVLS